MKAFRNIFLVALICVLGSVDLWAGTAIKGEVLFSTPIESPSKIVQCDSKIWVYSVEKKSVFGINPDSGAIETAFLQAQLGLSDEWSVQTLSCFRNMLLMTKAKKQGPTFEGIQFSVFADPTKVKVQAFKLPGQGLVHSLTCSQKSCFILRESIYESQNLSDWKLDSLPLSEKVAIYGEELREKDDIFMNWQDPYLLAGSKYTRLLADDSGLLALDQFRANLVYRPSSGDQKPHRFGKWGVWEGTFMYPKGLAWIDQKYFAVSDTGTGMVSVYSVDGLFMGTFKGPKGYEPFDYPIDMTSYKKRLYLADFRAGKVYGLKLPEVIVGEPDESAQGASQDVAAQIRANWFRHSQVQKNRSQTRCLSCHDGTVVDSLTKLKPGKNHHPVDVEAPDDNPKGIDLPLESGGVVGCGTCHQSHHKSVPGTKAFLRKSEGKLCLTCHLEKSNPENNHFAKHGKLGGKDILVNSCLQCHVVHAGGKHLIKTSEITTLCVSCHGNNQKPQGHVFEGKLECTNCHSIHESKIEVRYAKQIAKDETCLGCHKEIKEKYKDTPHFEYLSPEKRKWNSKEQVCMECHGPHRPVVPKGSTPFALCLHCHSDHNQWHKAKITIADTDPGTKVRLYNNQIMCKTCHGIHGGHPDPVGVKKFCASCHGDDETNSVFSQFHKRLKKGK